MSKLLLSLFRYPLGLFVLLFWSPGHYCHQQLELDAIKTNSLIDSSALLLSLLLASNGSDALASNADSRFSRMEDPELDMTTPQLIAHRGYPVEIHEVTTSDGYILELHRIPYSRRVPSRFQRSKQFGNKYANRMSTRPVVFLQHGLLCSSSDWVLNPTDRGLAYMLADRGYDVWMGNARGNTYSKKHIFLKESDEAFWRFTWDEMGLYDIPATLEYILRTTGRQKLIYIGHSMGTTMFWVAMETHPELNDKIELMVGLAPVASVSRMKSPIRIFTPFIHEFQLMFEWFGTKAFLPSGPVLKLLSRLFCDQTKWEEDFCENIFFLLSGSDPANFNEEMVPLITTHTPAGTSTYTIFHYMQEYSTAERYTRMDWGTKQNMEEYGQPTPPPYNLTTVTAPVVLYWGENDWLASPKDVTWLAKRLTNLQGFYRVNMTAFNHLDFLWATHVDQLLYNHLLQLLPYSY